MLRQGRGGPRGDEGASSQDDAQDDACSASRAVAADASANGPVLCVEGLVRRFGELTAVDGLSLRIEPGQTYGLLGPNGAGKTTTISMVAGLLSPHAGTVRVLGRPVGPREVDVRRHLGLVPQDLAIYPELTARENLAFFAALQGMRGRQRSERIAEVLETISLTDRADEPTKKFSGGMKRRLNIAIGLVHRPALLILDEPTVGVDPQSRNAILEAVETLSGEGMAVLYTTHYMEEAERLCERIGIIDSGRIRAEGTRDELITLTGGVDTVRLIGSSPCEESATALRELAAVETVVVERNSLTLMVHDAPAAVAQIVTIASGAGMSLQEVEIVRPDLESVFLHLTGKALRD